MTDVLHEQLYTFLRSSSAWLDKYLSGQVMFLEATFQRERQCARSTSDGYVHIHTHAHTHTHTYHTHTHIYIYIYIYIYIHIFLFRKNNERALKPVFPYAAHKRKFGTVLIRCAPQHTLLLYPVCWIRRGTLPDL